MHSVDMLAILFARGKRSRSFLSAFALLPTLAPRCKLISCNQQLTAASEYPRLPRADLGNTSTYDLEKAHYITGSVKYLSRLGSFFSNPLVSGLLLLVSAHVC